ncbi:uncharacterized protein TNCV_4187761 [Trichonephila clavipes]|nr:uncharacterized protein TNCV_4187761 [Trichonephila clavipes]
MKECAIWVPSVPKGVFYPSKQNDRHHVVAITGLSRYHTSRNLSGVKNLACCRIVSDCYWNSSPAACPISFGQNVKTDSSQSAQFDVDQSQNNCNMTWGCKDHQARRRFVEWAQNEIAIAPDFQKQILFSDEAHFWLNDYVNKQNCRIWSEANPQVYVETPLHPEKLTVRCALWAGGFLLQKR